MHMVMGVYIQNILSWCLFFLSPSGRRCPLEMIYYCKYPRSWSFRIHMVNGVYLQNQRSSCLFFPALSGGRCPLEMKYNYPNTLGHGVSNHLLWVVYVAQLNHLQLAAVNIFFHHLQEVDALWKMIYTYQSILNPVVSEYICLQGYISIIIGVVACFCCTFRRMTTFGNET